MCKLVAGWRSWNGDEWIECHTRVLLGCEMATMTSLVHSESVSYEWSDSKVVYILPRCMECRHGLVMSILSVHLSLSLSVCLSVSPSVKHVNCDKTKERSVQIFIPYERSFSIAFCEEERLVGGNPFYLKFWLNRPSLERNCRFWTSIRS